MITRQVTIEGKEYTLGMSAYLPKEYRAKYGRDFVVDMGRIPNILQGKESDVRDSVIEDVVWQTLKHGRSDIGEDEDEWLMSLNSPFAMYEIIPVILEMWAENNKTTSIPRKK